MPNRSIPAYLLADGQAVVAAILSGKKPAAELAQRVRARAAKITAETKDKHGILQIGTAAIRELRDA